MTAKELQNNLRSKNKFNNILNYCFAGVIIIVGICFLILMLFEWGRTSSFNKYGSLFIPGLFLAIGAYIIWRIPQKYHVYEVISSASIEDKIAVIENYLKTKWGYRGSIKEGEGSYGYTGSFLADIRLVLHIDNEKILFNAQGNDSNTMGVVDFGMGYRAAKKLKKYLEQNLA